MLYLGTFNMTDLWKPSKISALVSSYLQASWNTEQCTFDTHSFILLPILYWADTQLHLATYIYTGQIHTASYCYLYYTGQIHSFILLPIFILVRYRQLHIATYIYTSQIQSASYSYLDIILVRNSQPHILTYIILLDTDSFILLPILYWSDTDSFILLPIFILVR